MRFQIDQTLLDSVRLVFQEHRRIYWIVGGSGSGKSTISLALAAKTGMSVYDMDSHIYGDYQPRFVRQQYPVNHAWISAENALAWQLNMSWDDFYAFQCAALPEYLDLFARDLASIDTGNGLIVDGGIFSPAVLLQAFPKERVICVARPERTSVEIWHESEDRLAMKGYIQQLPEGEAAWDHFLDLDMQITQTILKECRENGIPVVARSETDTIQVVTDRFLCIPSFLAPIPTLQ